jgi:hypothetical protein
MRHALDDPGPIATRQAGADGECAREHAPGVDLPEHEEDVGRTSGNIVSSATADPIRLVQEDGPPWCSTAAPA